MMLDDFYRNQLDEANEWIVGRVIVDYGTRYTVLTDYGQTKGQVSGKYRNMGDELPVIGDYVLLSLFNDESEGLIHGRLKRKTEFARKIAGTTTEKQVQGANFDVVFIMMALNNDFNVRKLERFVLTAWDTGGARPVVILSKADLCEDVGQCLANARAAAPGVDVHVISAIHNDGLESLEGYLVAGSTIAIFGASGGVGKSTLINTLAGKKLMKVNDVRFGDDRGKHTTTHREIIFLGNDISLIDTLVCGR